MIDWKNLTRKLNRLKPYDCDVGEKQHAKLLEFVSTVHNNGSKVINELIEEGGRVLGDNNVLKDYWHQDVVERRLDYEKDQQRSGMSNSAIIKPCQLLIHAHYSCAVTEIRGNRWNQITIRMGVCFNLHPYKKYNYVSCALLITMFFILSALAVYSYSPAGFVCNVDHEPFV